MSVHSIVDELVASMPSDMPDLKEATNHLAPLNLPAQIVIYYPERQDRLGWVVRETPSDQETEHQASSDGFFLFCLLLNRILQKHRLSELNGIA